MASDVFTRKSKSAGEIPQRSKTRNISRAKANPAEPFPHPLPSPMLAKLVENVMDNPDWIYEMKLDGYRMIAAVNDGTTQMLSRRGLSYSSKYDILLEDLSRIEDTVILDGEIVAENDNGINDFQLLQNYGTTRIGNLKYFVFDILYLNGHNLMDFPLKKRKELLGAFFEKYDFKRVYNLPFQEGHGKKLFEELSARGYEGIIAKDPSSTYLPGKRGETWLKLKATSIQEAVICGFTEPQNSRKYFGSLILGVYEQNNLKYAGNCGTGFSDESLRELHDRFNVLKTDSCPFREIPRFTGSKGRPKWIRPVLVANIKFLGWSRDGIMRAPVFMGLREDKSPGEVVNETKEMKEDLASKRSGLPHKNSVLQAGNKQEKDKIMVISGQEVKCTNLNKVYWPAEGYTKGDLISYYLNISKVILPYLKDRPQSLNRHPDGIRGKNFYHKDMDVDGIPSWLETVKMESKSNPGGIDYLICNNAATLAYMANLGCIEINPWHSTYRNPDNPDYLMLDLDPGDISFVDVVNTALVIKELCDEIQVSCHCKTSGATGLHIYIPLGAKYDYDQARTFAEILAGIANYRLPSTTSIERAVSKRKDKIYIDFLQNRKGQTLAAPYSVRPRPYATVSTPLDWKEVNHHLTPEMFTIRNIEKRLVVKGDLWQAVINDAISLPKALKGLEKLRQ